MRDGEDALNEGTMGRLSDRDEAKEGVDRGEPSVASADGVVPLRFQIIEKRAHERCVDIREEQRGGGFEQSFLGESEE
jgi:hypothetical protein